jgi:hypothetical protein
MPFQKLRQYFLPKDLPEPLIAKKAADRDGHQPVTFLPHLFFLIHFKEIGRNILATQEPHMPTHPFFHPFSDPPVTLPREAQVVEQLAKFLVI